MGSKKLFLRDNAMRFALLFYDLWNITENHEPPLCVLQTRTSRFFSCA